MWVPTNRRISGNETVDKAAKSGSAHSFTWQEPTCGISDTSARWAIRGWINGAHLEYWEPTFRHKCVQCFLEEPPLPQIWGLLQLNKFYLRQMMELFTRHCHLKGHLFKTGLVCSPMRKGCNDRLNSSNVLYDCQVLAETWFCHLGVPSHNQMSINSPHYAQCCA